MQDAQELSETIQQPMADWRKQQSELQDAGLAKKECVSLATEGQRLKETEITGWTYKNLTLETYKVNLNVYLSKVSSSAATTWEDFDNAIIQLQTAST